MGSASIRVGALNQSLAARAVFTDCVFQKNESALLGGAVYSDDWAHLVKITVPVGDEDNHEGDLNAEA